MTDSHILNAEANSSKKPGKQNCFQKFQTLLKNPILLIFRVLQNLIKYAEIRREEVFTSPGTYDLVGVVNSIFDRA